MMFSSVNNKQIPANCIHLYFLIAAFLIGITAQAQTSFLKNDNANPLQHFAVTSLRQSYPAFTDIDNDGDLDCFSGEFNYSKTGVVSSHISFFRNDGTAKHPLFTEAKGNENPLSGVAITGSVVPVFADIDGDGRQDCFIANSSGAITFYKNEGTANKAVFVKQSAAFNPLSGVKFSGIAISQFVLSDIDKDGDMDCLITDKEGNEMYFTNTGSATKPQFANRETNNPFAILANTPVSTLSLYDWNKDGRPDLFTDKAGYQNNIASFARLSFSPVPADDNHITSTSWVDLNGDGIPELVNGTTDGCFTYSTLPSADIKAMASITISPNPSAKYFTVTLAPSDENRMLKVTNADGKIVLSKNVLAGSYTFGENLVKGAYFVQILSSGKTIAESKILKL